MSAPKVVIRNSLFFLTCLCLAAQGASAAEKKAAPREKKGKTVGELLKRIEENTKKVKLSAKTQNALPQFQKMQEAPAVAPRKVNLSEVRPPSRSRRFYEEGTDEAKLEKLTDDGIAELYKLSQQFKTSKRRGEIWLRLAEAYTEKARLIEYRVSEQYDEKLKDFQAGRTKEKPKLDLSASQEYNRKAVQLYDWFLRDFPKDSKVDQALFFLGYNNFELQQEEKGRGYYERLTKEYPSSNYIEEANFALGEYYFDREKWADALKYYQKVGANKRNRLYGFGLYKIAWCEYKLGEVKAALAALEKVIRSGRQAKGEKDSSVGGVSRIRMATEAVKDLVIFYAEVGTADKARSYFEDIAGVKQTPGLLEKLAYFYVDTGNREGARLLFRDLILENPNAPKAYDYQYQIVSMFSSSLGNKTFKEELFNWISTYGPDSEWYKANAKDKELLARSQQLIETTLRNHILTQHQNAQNSKTNFARGLAKDGYELYFQTFKDSNRLDEMHFFYAELLFDMDDFELAAVHYAWVTDNAPKSKYFEKSSLNTILALEKKLPSEGELKKLVGQSLDAIPIGKNVQGFIDGAEKYSKFFSKADTLPAIRYKVGALYYYHNHFDKALEAFNGIIKDYPKTKFAQNAANLVLDIYNLKKDYAGLETAGQAMLENKDLADSQVGDQVKGVLQRASFKKAQDLEAQKDYAGAAKAYEEFAAKNPGDLSVQASFNAAVNYERAGDAFKAISMYALVLATKGDKHADMKNNSSKFVAALYERTGQYARAAEAFEGYAAKNPKDKESVNFIYNAAVIRDGMNSYNQALANYQKHFDTSKSADRFEDLFAMAKIWERRGNNAKAIEFYKKYYEARPQNGAGMVEAAFSIAQYHAARKQIKEAEEWYGKTIFQQRKHTSAEKPVGVSFAAESKFNLVYKTYTELREIKIPADPAKQGPAVQKKLAKLNRLNDQLKEVIAYDDGYMIVASLTLLGQAYQHMAASVYGAPKPKGLDAEGLKQYQAGIDKIAKPFEDQAVKSYESAIEKGFKTEGYNQWLKAAQQELHKLNKDKYVDRGEIVRPSKLVDILESEWKTPLKPVGEALKEKDEKKLVAEASKILGSDPDDLVSLNSLAVFYFESGKYGLARLILNRALQKHGDEAVLHNNLGVVYLAENKQRPAILSLRKSIELKNDYTFAAANLGAIYLEYKDYARAGDLLSSSYSGLKSDLRRGVGLDVANNYALTLAASGGYEKARSIYQEILKVEAQNVPALFNYAILLVHNLKDKKEGEKFVSKLRFLVDDAQTKKKVEALEAALAE